MRFKKYTITVNGKKVSYWEKNSHQASVIILLHGFSSSHKGMIDMSNNIKNYRLIIPDLPACGHSEPLEEKHNAENYASWLNDFLAVLFIEKAVIIGYSLGSRVALFFSENFPLRVDKLVLITPVIKADSSVAKLSLLAFNIAEILPLYMKKRWLFNKFFKVVSNRIIFKSSSKKRRQKLIDMDAREMENLNIRANIEIFDDFYRSESISKGGKIDVKTLIIACDKDEVATLSSVKELCQRFSNAQLKIMKESGHVVVLERPSAIGSLIHRWLQ